MKRSMETYVTLVTHFVLVALCLVLYTLQLTLASSMNEYGEICDDDFGNSCDQSKFLICLNGKCNCSSPDTMIYNETRRSCAVKLYSSCLQEESYTKNVLIGPGLENVASHTVKFARKLPCVSYAVCGPSLSFNKCVCPNPADTGTNDTICTFPSIITTPAPLPPSNHSLSVGASCDYQAGLICAVERGLECVDGKCQCKIQDQQYFNGTQCLSLVDGPCGEDSLECTPLADCVPSGRHFTCQCTAGFVKSQMGTCIPDYDQPCDDRKGQHCRKDTLLKCVNGKCQCEAIVQTYDNVAKKCRGLVGAACKKSTYGNRKYYTIASSDFCVENAFCDAKMEASLVDNQNRNMFGLCTCSSCHLETVNRTCVYNAHPPSC